MELENLNIQVLATPRSGSSYLCSILNNYPGYKFNVRQLEGKEPAERKLSKNSKQMPREHEECNVSIPALMEKYPDTRFIHLMRRDLVAQAASYYIARTCKCFGIKLRDPLEREKKKKRYKRKTSLNEDDLKKLKDKLK